MFTIPTLKQALLVVFVAVLFAAACSSDGGRGDQLVLPDTTDVSSTTVDATPTSDAPSTVVDAPPTTDVQSTTPADEPSTTADGDDTAAAGHTHDDAAPLTIPTDISSASELPPGVPIPPAEGFEVITGDDTYTGDHDDHTTTTTTATPVTTTTTPTPVTTTTTPTPVTTTTTATPSVALPPIVGEPIDAAVADTTETFHDSSGMPTPRTVPLHVEIGTLIESTNSPFGVFNVVVVGFNDYGSFQEIEACDADGHHWAAYAWLGDDGLWRIEVSGPSPYLEGATLSAWRYGGQTC